MKPESWLFAIWKPHPCQLKSQLYVQVRQSSCLLTSLLFQFQIERKKTKVYPGSLHTEILLEMLMRISFGLKVNSTSFYFCIDAVSTHML